jgi:hypothetical protein
MILITSVNRKTGEVTRRIEDTPGLIDYIPLAVELAKAFDERGNQHANHQHATAGQNCETVVQA